MTKEYLEMLSELMKRAVPHGFESIKLEVKHFFSGAAVYADGKICMTFTPAGFAIKLPEESRIILIEQRGANSLRYFPKGPIKKDYVVLPKPMLDDMEPLRHWVKTSIEYVVQLSGAGGAPREGGRGAAEAEG